MAKLGEYPNLFNENENYLFIKYFLEHKFDLLGSGWAKIFYGMKCRGIEENKYEIKRNNLLKNNVKGKINILKLIDNKYIPIDWHIDFKSGYRWSKNTLYRNIKYGYKDGVDVKVPWELARMQHLPQMAEIFHCLKEDYENKVKIKKEFRNQILDFIASNPPMFGVNWACTMDVAIRAVNWILAYDIFISDGNQFDDDFKKIFTQSIYEHGLHIVKNLEWNNEVRGNHYLANIAGLAFISIYLQSNTKTDAWLAFSVQNLINEVEHQFYKDGGNFEGSTAYHRLSAEMVYFTTAIILGLSQERREGLKKYDYKALKTGCGKPKFTPAPITFYKLPEGSDANYYDSPFPSWYFERLERMAEFIIDITKHDGHILQIGDNDSGRFLKLGPKYEKLTVKKAKEKYANLEGYTELSDEDDYFMEDHLDCSHLVSAAYGLLARDDFADWLGGIEKASKMPDYLFIKALSGGTNIGSQRFKDRINEDKKYFSIGNTLVLKQFDDQLKSNQDKIFRNTEFKVNSGNLHEGLEFCAYKDFGLYIYRSKRLYLVIRCWTGCEPFHSAHMHHDQLSIELVIDGKEIITDPGTYVYTSLPEQRNRYRSVKAHFTPWMFKEEPSFLSNKYLFKLNPIKCDNVLFFNDMGFIGSISINNIIIYKIIIIEENIISLKDYVMNLSSNDNCKIIDKKYNQLPVSPGYGIVFRN